jgi:muramoyltetrapeptide carboxypeptidase
MIRPRVLQPGSRIMLVAPAGPVSPEKIEASLERCIRFGFEPVLAPSARLRQRYLAGPDAARAADLQSAIDDDTIDAIWAMRGGYGTVRLLPMLDFTRLLARPKAFIGFSDNTTLHLALARLQLVSFHGPHAAAEFPPLTEECFRRVLLSTEPAGVLPTTSAPTTLQGGSAEGPLAGGNLALLAAACGTSVSLQGAGCIILIEDVGEPVYRVDRMLTQLARAGALEGALALGFGRFSEIDPPEDEDAMHELLHEFAAPLGIPAVSGLPFGHVDENWTLPFGVRARLDADAGTLEILESAVTNPRNGSVTT